MAYLEEQWGIVAKTCQIDRFCKGQMRETGIDLLTI